MPSFSFSYILPATNSCFWYRNRISDGFPGISAKIVDIPAKRLGFPQIRLLPGKDEARTKSCTKIHTACCQSESQNHTNTHTHSHTHTAFTCTHWHYCSWAYVGCLNLCVGRDMRVPLHMSHCGTWTVQRHGYREVGGWGRVPFSRI